MKKILFFLFLILFYSYQYDCNPYFYILENNGIKKCFSDDCTNYIFEKSNLISPFCKKVYVLADKNIYNPNNYIIKENSFFDPVTKTYITKSDGYLVYCVNKNNVLLFLVFSIIYIIFVYFLSKCHCIKKLKNNYILIYGIFLTIIYSFITFYFFKNVVLFYFDNFATIIFFIFLSSALIFFSISKSMNLFFDRVFLYEMILIFILLEIISLFSLNLMIIILTIIFLFIFSNQFQKMKLVLSGSKIEKYEKENEIKKKFSKYCKIDNVYIVKSNDCNAFAVGLFKKDIYLTSKLIENFDEKEIESIIAHEVGHHYYQHILKILIITIIPCLFIYILHIDYELKELLYIFYTIFMIIAIKYIKTLFEKEADKFAAKIVGKKYLISTIIKVSKINGSKENFSIFHPSVKERLNNILNIQE